MKPIIGITGDVDVESGSERNGGGKVVLNFNYLQAVVDAGGVPLIIPPQADPSVIASLLDGLLIPGGGDIDAAEFGEDNHPSVESVAKERFQGEKALFAEISPKLPVLGICYGCQFINVVQGGSLIQHLPDFVGHEDDRPGTVQSYSIDEGSKLGSLVGSEATGQSWHHQAIKEIGRDLTITARNADGTIEAIESTSRPWLIGIQWHPERTGENPASQKIFASFIQAARDYRDAAQRDHEYFDQIVRSGLTPKEKKTSTKEEMFEQYKQSYGFSRDQ